MLGQKINSFSVKGFLQGIFSCSNTIKRPNLWYTNSRCSIMQTRKFERENATQDQYPWRTSYVQRPDQTREVHWLRCPPTFQSLRRQQKESQSSTRGGQEVKRKSLTHTIIYGVLQKRRFLKHSSTGFLAACINLILGTHILVYVLVHILRGICEIRSFALQGHKIRNLHHPSKPNK